MRTTKEKLSGKQRFGPWQNQPSPETYCKTKLIRWCKASRIECDKIWNFTVSTPVLKQFLDSIFRC